MANNMLIFIAVSGAINAITSTVLCIIVYRNNRSSVINKTFAMFALYAALWSYPYIFWPLAHSKVECLFWFRMLHIGAILIPVGFYHFVIAFLEKKDRRSIIPAYLLALFFLTFSFSKYYIADMRSISFLPYYGVPGVLYVPFLVMFFGYAIYSLYLMFSDYGNFLPQRKAQVLLIGIGTLIGFIGGSTNYLPWFNIPIPPFLNCLVSIYVIATAYAIIRHGFLDIQVIIKKTLVFASLFTIVFGIFVGVTLLLQQLIGGAGNLLGLAVSSIVIIFTVRPLEIFLTNATNKYLFQKKYDPVELIISFSKSVLTELALDKICKSTIDNLSSALNLTNCAILIPNKEGNKFIIKESFGIINKNLSYGNNSPVPSYLNKVNNVIVQKGEKPLSETIINDMKLIDAEVCLSIMIHKQLIGMISLGKKKSDEEYTKNDIDTLMFLSDALGIAITNALNFEDARQKEKLAAIGMLAAGIKHDIGTPLNRMSTAVQMFLIAREDGDHKKMPPEQIITDSYDLLTRCQMTFEKVSGITAKFADFAKPKRRAELDLVSIPASIEEALSVLEHEIQVKGISVKKEIQSDIPPIRADKEYMQEIFFNIIRNATQAIEEAHRSKDESFVTIIAQKTADKNVLVEIRDTGVGIPADSLNKIFEAYYTTKQGGGGTGLGLAIVKELIERNDGKISVKSELGKGTTFVLEFPGA